MARNLQVSPSEGGIRSESEEGISDTTDGSGDHTHTMGSLRRILDKGSVQVSVEGGFVANVTSISGNDVTFRVFESAGSAAALAAAGSQAITYNIQAEGY